jgi:hypothetical protein
MSASNDMRVITGEIFGHATDFVIETERRGDQLVMKITTIPPPMELRDGELRAYPAPRWPWPETFKHTHR